MSHQACPKLLLAVTLLLGLAAIQVNSLDCVQCSSKKPECNIVGLIPPTRCPDGSHYCTMTMVLSNNGRLVLRGCSPTKLSGCRPWSTDKVKVTACYDSCPWDGCNAPRRPTL